MGFITLYSVNVFRYPMNVIQVIATAFCARNFMVKTSILCRNKFFVCIGTLPALLEKQAGYSFSFVSCAQTNDRNMTKPATQALLSSPLTGDFVPASCTFVFNFSLLVSFLSSYFLGIAAIHTKSLFRVPLYAAINAKPFVITPLLVFVASCEHTEILTKLSMKGKGKIPD